MIIRKKLFNTVLTISHKAGDYSQSISQHIWLVFIIYVIISTLVFIGCTPIFFSELNSDPRMTIIQMIEGTAHRPFVTRLLMPVLVSFFSTVLKLDPLVVTIALMYLFFIGITFATHYFLKHFFSIGQVILLSIATPICLTPFLHQVKMYDFSSLFFFTFSLILLYTKRWVLYFLVFFLAVVGKETAFLLIVIFLLFYYKRLPKELFVFLFLMQILLFNAIHLLKTYFFMGNPGRSFEFHFLDQVAAFSSHPVFSLIFYLVGFAVIWLILYRWKEKTAFLRMAFLGTAPILIVLFIVGGGVYEIRALLEAFPSGLALGGMTILYFFNGGGLAR